MPVRRGIGLCATTNCRAYYAPGKGLLRISRTPKETTLAKLWKAEEM